MRALRSRILSSDFQKRTARRKWDRGRHSSSFGVSIHRALRGAIPARPRPVRHRLPTRSAWLQRVALAPAPPPCRRRRSPEGFRLAGCPDVARRRAAHLLWRAGGLPD